MDNHFVEAPDSYRRDLNVLKHYVTDMATYLHKRTGKDLATCMEWVKAKTQPGGDLGITDPEALVLSKEVEGERTKVTMPLSHYLKDITDNRRILSPTMAVYHHPDAKKSLLSEYISINIQKRGVSKKEMFQAESRGNEEMRIYKDNEQKSAKIKNNSLSGAQASAHTILRNKSAHSSLTSTCRSATSYGNANNEKFLMGNRHYWSPDVVKANVISIINHTDYPALEQAMVEFGIRHPSVDETFACITYSSDLYWRNPAQKDEIHRLVTSLSDIERSAFVYSGDLYHLAQYNDQVVRTFLEKLSTKATAPVDDPDTWVGMMDDDLKAFVCLLCAEELSTTDEKTGTVKGLKEQNWTGYCVLAATAKKIIDTLDEYQNLIKGLWRVNTLPASIAHIRSSLRRSAVTSDTDSTIFTVQYWTEWYVGGIDFDQKSLDISYAIVYLASQSITHVLAMLSAGMGVVPDQIHDLAMKNEYAFPVFCLTSKAKHYFAYISAKEGNVYDKYKTEVKGVQLKDSNCPPHVMAEFHKTLNWIMDEIIKHKQISLETLYKRIGAIEWGIHKSVMKGDSTYLTAGQIKDAGSYAKPMSSNYQHYVLWQHVFAPKYGEAPEPPFSTTKVQINIKNQTALKSWLDEIKDRELAERLETYLREQKRTGVTSLMLPRAVVEVTGLPEEIIQAMDIRGLIMSTVRPFYLALESLGIFLMNGNNTKLVSDIVTPDGTLVMPDTPTA